MSVTTATGKLITATLRESTLILDFADPSSRNSFSVRAANELREILATYQGKIDALLFSASGRVFCSGGNLSNYAAMNSPDEGKTVNREITAALDEVSRLPVPTVCMVKGDCFGGGVELMSAFDVVLSAPHVMYGLWQRKIGLSFGWGGGQRLESRLGAKKLSQLALQARVFGAFEALKLGLIDRISPESTLMSDALFCALSLAKLPKAPVAALKDSVENEQENFEQLWMNPEHAAILKKRV